MNIVTRFAFAVCICSLVHFAVGACWEKKITPLNQLRGFDRVVAILGILATIVGVAAIDLPQLLR